MIQQTRSVADHIRAVAREQTTEFHLAAMKAAVPSALTSDPDYSSLLELEGAREFRQFVERRLLAAQIDAWRVPFATKFALQSTVPAGAWVAEGKPIPASAFAAQQIRLAPAKVATIIVLSQEMLQRTDSLANTALIRLVGRGLGRAANTAFLSVAAASGGTPGGLLENATTIPSTGTTAAALAADLGDLIEAADDADADLTAAAWILSPARAAAIALALGLDDLGLRGGTLLGAPAFTDPAAGDTIALVDAMRVAVAIGPPDVAFADATTLEMLDNPTNASDDGTAANMVSMFQTDSVAVRATIPVNWTAAANSVFAIVPPVS